MGSDGNKGKATECDGRTLNIKLVQLADNLLPRAAALGQKLRAEKIQQSQMARVKLARKGARVHLPNLTIVLIEDVGVIDTESGGLAGVGEGLEFSVRGVREVNATIWRSMVQSKTGKRRRDEQKFGGEGGW